MSNFPSYGDQNLAWKCFYSFVRHVGLLLLLTQGDRLSLLFQMQPLLVLLQEEVHFFLSCLPRPHRVRILLIVWGLSKPKLVPFLSEKDRSIQDLMYAGCSVIGVGSV